MDIQERYETLYNKVESEMKELKVADSLFELCSVSLDRTGKENQINIELLLESTLEAKKQLKNSFDRNSQEYGFILNYVNLSGNL